MPPSRRRKGCVRLRDEHPEDERRKRAATHGKVIDAKLVATAKEAKRTYKEQMHAVRSAGSAGDQFGQLKAALKALEELGKVLA